MRVLSPDREASPPSRDGAVCAPKSYVQYVEPCDVRAIEPPGRGYRRGPDVCSVDVGTVDRNEVEAGDGTSIDARAAWVDVGDEGGQTAPAPYPAGTQG